MPAGKLELYHIIPSEEKLREQARPREDFRHLTPEPTPSLVPSVPTRTQVSLGVEWGLASPQPPGVGLWFFSDLGVRGHYPVRLGS